MKLLIEERLTMLETMTNRITDSASEWWPFAFLRPAQHERLSSMRCLLISVLYGLPAALMGLLAGTAVGDPVRDLHLFAFPAIVCLMSFLLFRLSFGFFWNRRAERLRVLYERRCQWKGAMSDSRPPARD